MNIHHQHVMVRVPATSANLGPGFDALGLALAMFSTFEVAVQDEVVPNPHIAVFPLNDDVSFGDVPRDETNLFYRVFADRLQHNQCIVPPVAITIRSDIPLARGLGSSATAVIGGILAADALAGVQHAAAEVVGFAASYECGNHADNVAAALYGGLVVVAKDAVSSAWSIVKMPTPPAIQAVVFIPDFPMETAAGRKLLPDVYSRADAVHNITHAALLVAAMAANDTMALRSAVADRFHEPYRAQVFPQMPEFIAAAVDAGAYGACLSGGGSTILAFAVDNAMEIAEALRQRARQLGVSGAVKIVSIDQQGAQAEIVDRGPAKIALRNANSSAMDEESLLECPHCGERADLRSLNYRCACGTPFDVVFPQAGGGHSGAEWRHIFDQRLLSRAPEDVSGVWRFRELLLPIAGVAPVTRPEGKTNLYPVGRGQVIGNHRNIGEFAGVDAAWIKHEGENPTGSFKDRGMTVGVSIAKWVGATTVACASTGNTSASMASYAAQAGLTSIVLLPEGKVATGKLGQAIAYGASIRQIAGDFDQAMVDVERMCKDEGIYLLNSLNPYRIAGQQSLGLEIVQQLGWNAPDWIVLPAGNLGNTSALGMGLLRAYHCGIITKLPRIASIQAAGANPFYRSFTDQFRSFEPVKAHTIATAINIGNPVSFERAKSVILATNGVVEQVTDDEIMAAKVVIDRAGIGCEPASAASAAGVRKLVQQGIIRADERVVMVLTGNLLKDPDAIMKAHLPQMEAH